MFDEPLWELLVGAPLEREELNVSLVVLGIWLSKLCELGKKIAALLGSFPVLPARIYHCSFQITAPALVSF